MQSEKLVTEAGGDDASNQDVEVLQSHGIVSREEEGRRRVSRLTLTDSLSSDAGVRMQRTSRS